MAVVNTMSVPSKIIEGSFEFGGPYLRMRWRWNQAHTAREIRVIEQTARGVGFGFDPAGDPREFYRADLGTLRSGHESGPCLDSSHVGRTRFFVRGDLLELDYKVFEVDQHNHGAFEALRHLVSAYNHAAAADGVLTRRASSVMGQDALQQKMQERQNAQAKARGIGALTADEALRDRPKDALSQAHLRDQHCNLKQAAALGAHLPPASEVLAELADLRVQLAAARADADRLRGGRTERKTFLVLTPVPGKEAGAALPGQGKDYRIQLGDNVEHLVIIHDPHCLMPAVDRVGPTTFVRVHTGIECTVVKVER